MQNATAHDQNDPATETPLGHSPTLAILRKLALGEPLSTEETVAFTRAVLVPACLGDRRLAPFARVQGRGACRREAFHPDARVDEAVHDGWIALLTPTGQSGMTACAKVWAGYAQGELSEAGALGYLHQAVSHAVGRQARRTGMGRLYDAVKGALAHTSGFAMVEDGNGRKFYAPAHGHRWLLAGEDLETQAIGQEIADRLGLLPLHGSWPTKLRGTLLPIIRASFDLLERRLTASQLTNLAAEALGLGGLRAQPVSLDGSGNGEEGRAALEAEVSAAWAAQHEVSGRREEEEAAGAGAATALADAWEAYWRQLEGRSFAQAARHPGKGSGALVILSMLSGADLEEMARYCGSGVSAVQERLSARGWAQRKLQRSLAGWEVSGRSRREQFAVPAKLAPLLGPLLQAPDFEVAYAAWEELRRRHAPLLKEAELAV